MIQSNTIDGLLLREMVIAGTAQLDKNREMVDALNVFPVPDGDTGTNMSLTMNSALREINAKEFNDASSAADALSRGALRGARGNSGVILSQILRGFSKEVSGNPQITPELFARALKRGADTAYKAVMKPKEGTILTVARVLSEDGVRLCSTKEVGFEELFNTLLKSGEAILQRTPEMLPVLKEAGVVDAGGRGFLFILTGFYMALNGGEMPAGEQKGPGEELISEEESPFTYHQEFTLRHIKETVTEESVNIFRRQLNRIGQNVKVDRDNDVIACSLFTNDPGKALQYGLDVGEIIESKLTNLKEERRKAMPEEASQGEAPAEKKEHKPYGFVSVSLGEGFAAIFKDLKVDVIVDGGQTMNPSIDDLAKAVDTINADTVFILPNNGNVILAAQQAAKLCDKNVKVIPTKNVAMGIAALVAFQPDQDADANAEMMDAASQNVRTGTITYAVRDTKYEGMEICQGDLIGLINGKLALKGDDKDQVAIDLMDSIVSEDDGLITLYYGADVTEEEAEALKDKIGERFPDLDVEALSGGQPLYYYIISVE